MNFDDMNAWLAQYNIKLEDLILFFTPIAAALAILIAGWLLAKLLSRWVRKRKFPNMEPGTAATIRPVLASVIGYFIFLSAIYAALTKLGVPSTSLLAAFGGAALAIGLALQGTLSNIASGIMLLFQRPLKVGETVEIAGLTCTVQEIGLFATTVTNLEGVYSYFPNSEVWKSRIQNFGRHTQRKLFVDVGVGYDTDLEKTRDLLLQTLRDVPFTLDDLFEPEVYVMSYGDSAINLSCRVMMPADDWLNNASTVRMAIKAALDKGGIEIPFPQRVMTMKK